MAELGDTGASGAARPAPAGRRRFYVASSANELAGPYPSYDIARVMAEHMTFCAVEAAAADIGAEAFARRLSHARAYFGSQLRHWLEAGMPSRRSMPEAADIEAIEPRILARNGAALAAYFGQGPGGALRSLYERLARRYLWAVHGVESRTVGSDVRIFMEPFHRSQALRQLAQSAAEHEADHHIQVVCEPETGGDSPHQATARMTWPEAAAVLRRHARFYRGFDRDLAQYNFTPWVRGKWDRFCAGAVILSGVARDELFDAGLALTERAAIDHGIDRGDNGVALRWMLVHLTQWCLASERGLL